MAVLEDVESQCAGLPGSNLPAEKPQKTKKKSPGLDKMDWEKIQEFYRNDRVIRLKVTKYNKGGVLVEEKGIRGFVPSSHLVDVPQQNAEKNRKAALSAYVGRSLLLKVIECDPQLGRLVLSERAAQANPGSRLELLDTLREGDIIQGRVTTVTNFGAFVDLGGVEGLVHISELSWGRVCHPRDVLTAGEEIQVCVLEIEPGRSRIALSLKRLTPNPWEQARSRYRLGQVTKARIRNIVSFGAFARLDDGLDGLIHVSEFQKMGHPGNLTEILAEGQEVEVCILHIDAEHQRLGLGLQVDGARKDGSAEKESAA